MKKAYVLFCILQLWSASFVNAQTPLQKIQTIPIAAKSIQLDQLQQLYILKTDNTLLKLDVKGKQQFEYSNTLLGDITTIDVTDPFNLAVYYGDYQTLVLLDRNLTELQVISLFELGFAQISSIAISNNQNIWLYDAIDFKLKKINRKGEVIFESGDLSLGIEKSINPTTLLERNNKIFANDSEQGIFVFDLFGQYLYRLDIKRLEHFNVFDEHLIYFTNHQLKSWGLQSKLEKTIFKWEKQDGVQQVLAGKEQEFYLRKKEVIEIWR